MPNRRGLLNLSFAFTIAAALATAQEPPYRNTNLSPEERAHDLVSRMTLNEKASQLEDWATAIPRLGIPDYQTWNEALHGVAGAGYATIFPLVAPRSVAVARFHRTERSSRLLCLSDLSPGENDPQGCNCGRYRRNPFGHNHIQSSL